MKQITIDDETYTALEQRASEHGTSVDSLTNWAAQYYLRYAYAPRDPVEEEFLSWFLEERMEYSDDPGCYENYRRKRHLRALIGGKKVYDEYLCTLAQNYYPLLEENTVSQLVTDYILDLTEIKQDGPFAKSTAPYPTIVHLIGEIGLLIYGATQDYVRGETAVFPALERVLPTLEDALDRIIEVLLSH